MEWLSSFKEETEAIWTNRDLQQGTYGFQIQKGTKWMPGLTEKEISAYEHDLGVEFSSDFRLFLSKMNGFDRPGLNVYGSSGEPHQMAVICYAYPKDLSVILERRQDLNEDWDEIVGELKKELSLDDPVDFVPIYSHRYILCPPNKPVVCSIVGSDAIIYGNDLKSYLTAEFLT